MNSRYQGPAVLPPAAEARKRVEAHLETLPGWEKPNRPRRAQKEETAKPRKRRRRR
jgi:hypothetical protein